MIDKNHPIGQKYKESLDEYDNKIEPLLNVNDNGIKGEIKLHEIRWIGEGSGKLILDNGKESNFYLEDNREIICQDEISSLSSHLKEVILLFRERGAALDKIMFPLMNQDE
ncbi:hypothetical protein J6TS7_59650 [Paenibacillus dendritiformis]|uniref:hypothetical protein n=1 Tax=Paenibacillus TaxID=44249 RepID=UPI001B06DBFF|nr:MULTISPECIES: hypothetical protein [Paenibacillus]MEB9896484.1 hypothetical protein [Bacillus cereus]GIO82355.1 hypothetical protein J6TS7_59650 [Paenibacillus dendritiformis]CAH8721249.1 hypothetical protein HTL2_006264 [Paenibacillus melissococcoides]